MLVANSFELLDHVTTEATHALRFFDLHVEISKRRIIVRGKSTSANRNRAGLSRRPAM